METRWPPNLYLSLRQYVRRRKYQRLNGSGKRSLQMVRLGGPAERRSWKKFRVIPKLRLRLRIRHYLSPVRILARLRDAYMNVMLGMAGKVGSLHSGADVNFGVQKLPKSSSTRKVSTEDFESRLMLEIYKSIAASRELDVRR